MTYRALFFLTIAPTIAFAVGCTVGSSNSAGSNDQTTVVTPAGMTMDTDSGVADAPTSRPSNSRVLGSPLCNASGWMGCYPDNTRGIRARDCDLTADAGAFDAAAWDTIPLACHVEHAANDAGVAPVCTPAGGLTESDPEHCTGPTDCAAGYECVAGGKCQPYCCAGECSHQDEFCDIQTTFADPSIRVPVCMPIDPCGLLDSSGGSCPPNQTCAVVRDDGATSCVAVGPREAGDDCSTDHCARGLVCLGTSVERSCYILCHMAPHTTECASTPKQTCKGGIPLSPVAGIGICQ
jgi:hypothetical protein